MATQKPVSAAVTHTSSRHDRVKYMKSVHDDLRKLGYEYMKASPAQSIIDAQEPEVEKFLAFLESPDLIMTRKLRTHSEVYGSLAAFITNPTMKFPVRFVERGEALLAKFKEVNWTINAHLDDEQNISAGTTTDTAIAPAPKAASAGAKSHKNGTSTDQAPPATHPIFGQDGIMHDVRVRHNAAKSYYLAPGFKAKSAKVYGHNGLKHGAWFPKRIVALRDGAHGEMVGGICGTEDDGAFSVVLSKSYEGLDCDKGDIIYYSGSGSHKNEDPINLPEPTSGTKALKVSLSTGHPVRVLRTGTAKSIYKPEVGIRYDGLYTVVEQKAATNKLGGKYERFKLVRLPGQPSFESLAQTPSAEQKAQYHKIQDGY